MKDGTWDVDETLHSLYSYIRSQATTTNKGLAYVAWQRVMGKRPTSFVVNSAGEAWRADKVSLLADLRTILLRQGYPVAFVARWDRAV